RHVRGHVNGLLHITARLQQHLAHLARQVARQLLLALLQQTSHLVEYLATLGGRRTAPAIEGSSRRSHRTIHVGRAGARESADKPARGGVGFFICAAGSGLLPLAVDIIAVDGSLAHVHPFLASRSAAPASGRGGSLTTAPPQPTTARQGGLC